MQLIFAVLQKINNFVFKNVEKLMENIASVTSFLLKETNNDATNNSGNNNNNNEYFSQHILKQYVLMISSFKNIVSL
mgnify:CR=1 FL=1